MLVSHHKGNTLSTSNKEKCQTQCPSKPRILKSIGLDNLDLSVQGLLAEMFRVKESTKMLSVL